VLVQLFLEGLEAHLAGLRQSVADSDPAAARLAAHSLKGNCGIVGADRLAVLAERVEDAAAAPRMSAVARDLAGLELEAGRVRAALATELQG
jgi:HPt (histidine-containing phosphotransfer) domain-containing protein